MQDGKLGYRRDLDGLRGIAVLLVIVSHAHFPVDNNGGDVGVTAFFVLSGYLITRLLIEERARLGRIDLRAFYARRFVRLAPALLVLIALVSVIGVWRGWAGDWQLGIVTCLLYVSNWVQVLGTQIDPLGHTWTLAIEEQFYLLWPAVLIVLGLRRTLWVAVVAVVAGALAQTVATGTLEYFSTITRGDAILVGCVLAIQRPRVPHSLGVFALAGLVFLGFVDWNHDTTIPLVVVATALIISSEVAVLGLLAPIGRRAYGLYLWDWPLTILFGALGGIIAFPVAALSYRLVESPAIRAWARRTSRSTRPPVEDAERRIPPAMPPVAARA